MDTSEKTCFKCHCVKPLTEFYKHSEMADGHLNKCKACTKTDVAKHRAENLARVREYDRQRGMLPHRVAARDEYRQTEEGKASVAKGREKYLRENRDSRLATTRGYYQRHKEQHKQRAKAYKSLNIDKVRSAKAASQRERHASKHSRTPAWLTPADRAAIKLRYAEARWMTRRTGFKHHVDHIVPLMGRDVCGLHVPWNLRVIPGRENMMKGNRR